MKVDKYIFVAFKKEFLFRKIKRYYYLFYLLFVYFINLENLKKIFYFNFMYIICENKYNNLKNGKKLFSKFH